MVHFYHLTFCGLRFFFLILPHRLYIVGGENVDISFKSCLLLAVFMLDSCLSSQPDLKRYFYIEKMDSRVCTVITPLRFRKF